MTKAEQNCAKKKHYETIEAARFFGRCDGLRPYKCICGKYCLTKKYIERDARRRVKQL